MKGIRSSSNVISAKVAEIEFQKYPEHFAFFSISDASGNKISI